MTRILLTLLALLTGLAAQVSPAQARVCAGGSAEIGAAQREESGARVLVQAVQALGLAAKQAAEPLRDAVTVTLPQFQVVIPTVQLGSDRSLT